MRHLMAFGLVAALAALSGCDKMRPLGASPDAAAPQVPTGDPLGGPEGPWAPVKVAACTGCHGQADLQLANADPLVAVAPPRALLSEWDPGAHRAHLVDGPFRHAVECASCHLLPTAPKEHPKQAQGKVTFSRLSTSSWSGSPLAPAWNGATCSGTYCHGNFKNGANATLAWSRDVTVACGSCHAVNPTNGPGGTHPTFSSATSCGACHGGAYTNTSVDLDLHMNGKVDAGGLACSTCHGDANRAPVATATALDPSGANLVKAAPPRDAGHGAAATGAHLAHVNQGDAAAPGPLSAAVACSACHQVPASVAHSDGAVGVVFGGLSTSGGAAPAPYDLATHTCASTYCHGNFAGGAGANALSWTSTGKRGCSSCHGAPPGPASATVHHPPNAACSTCHPGYSATTVAVATHVDGKVDHVPATGCTQCHGDLTAAAVAATDVRAAPASNASAVDAHGNASTATASRGVGAHAKHLTGTAWRSTPIACGECHAVPAQGDVTHANGNAAVAFGALARTSWSGQPAIAPAWNGAGGGTSLTCSSTYCHGAFKNGASAAPTWAAPSAVACGSCHAVSATNGPGGTHPTFGAGQSCGSCHGGTYTNTTVDKALHLNGALDVASLTCSSCHGDGARAPVASATAVDVLGANLVKASPPADAGHGAAATGAHLAHVNQGDAAAPGALSSAIACASCHAVPASTAHSNGAIDVTFAGLATAAGAIPAAYNLGTHTCASTYCHGNFAGGAGANAILWTSAGKLGCASCHGAPPGLSATAHHPPNAACAACHPGYTASTVAAATHVDGVVNHTPATGCTQCHGDLTAAAVAATDVRAAPASNANAVDAHGNASTATASRGVGAHARHLTGTTWRSAPIACGECHAVPASGDVTHANGNPAVAFGALARMAWAGEPAIAPAWNGAGGAANLTCSSTYCHGAFKNGASAAPTWAAPSAVACGSCHAVSATNGPGGTHPTIPAGQTCGSCHGGTYTNTTVDKALHMNGVVDGGGHPAGWKEPDQHGLAALGGLSACTACHVGFGPSGPASSSCDGCHATPSVYGPYTTGTYPNHASWQTECTFCHGGRGNTTGAPPRNTHVISTSTVAQPTTDATIGAHASHVTATHGLSLAFDCTACHQTRWTSATDPGHLDKATADVFFNAVGATANPGTYARPGCSSTYCHGNFPGGAGSAAVTWTGTFGGALTLSCGTSCHQAPPGPASATNHHPPNAACASCHSGYTATAVNAATHVDGSIQHAPATGCTQCHGDLTAAGVASTDLRAAPASNANAVDAHGNASTATGSRGVGAHAKHLTGTAWRSTPIACSECHAVPASGDVAHANGNPAVAFGALARTAWSGQPAITPAWNGAGGAANLTCASTYCHGAFKNGANAAPTWAAPSAVGCGSCHAVSATNGAGGTHPAFGAGQNCGSCHGGAYTNTAVDPALHLNGALDVTNLTCSSCHGDGARAPVASATAVDTLGANLVKASPPVDAGHGAAATGAHLAHVNQGDTSAPGPLSNALACASCHAVPSSTAHSNGAVDVTFAGLSVTGGAAPSAYNLTSHTCASTYCHGNFTGGAGANAITWTAAGKLGCSSCHGAPPGPASATLHHPPNANCVSCHAGYTATTVAVATHVNGTIEHTPATGCTQCHGDLSAAAVASSDVRAAPAVNANAVDAHGNPAGTTSARGVGAHAKHLTGTAWRSAPIACAECHAVPATGDVAHANGNPAVAFGALARTAWAGQPAINPAWNGANGGTTLTCASVYCHGAFKNGANAAPTWATPSAVTCGSCHAVSATNGPGGTHPAIPAGGNCGSCHGGAYTNTTIDPALHMNGKVDGGGESGGGTSCGSCHSVIWDAMNGTVAKATKHALLSDVPVDDATAWTGANLAGVAPASRSCVNMCHGDHTHDLTSPVVATHEYNVHADASTQALRGGTARTSATRDNTDYDPALASGGLCVSCHQKPVNAGHPAIGKAVFDASAHDFTSNTVGTTTYSWAYQLHDGGRFLRNCTKCHASNAEGTTPTVAADGSGTGAVHYSDNGSLLSGTTNPAGTAAGFVCYNCHGSAAAPANGTANANRSNKDVATAAGRAFAHPVNADAVHDGAIETTAGFNSGRFSGANRHASCLDCHSPHSAGSAAFNRSATATATRNQIPAGNPMTGALGVTFTYSATAVPGACAANPANPSTCWPATTAANYGTSLTPATKEYEVCFKCHTSFAFGSTYPTASATGASGLGQTDLGTEFNPGLARSGHPVVAGLSSYTNSIAPKNLNATQLLPPWNTNAGTQTMLCTDCHTQEAAAPVVQGPHGSAVRFLLAGANKAWPYTVAGVTTGTLFRVSTSETGLGTANGLFCRNCHPQQNSTASNSLHTQFAGQHGSNAIAACTNCHLRVPHGGKVSRLIVTTNAPARYKVGTPNMTRFLKNAAYRSYSVRTNVGTSCGEHSSGGTGGESW